MRRRNNEFNLLSRKEFPTPAEAAAASATPPSADPPWTELPLDLTANILQRLGAVEILQSAQNVCATWRNLCQDPAMWRVINVVNPDDVEEECTIMCRRAVDRSQGQLIDLTVAYFGDDELLDYIVHRSSHLRRLTVACCYDISGTAVDEAVEKLPELEELQLIMPSFLRGDIKMISISCSMLKSFTLDQRWCSHPLPEYSEDYSDDEFVSLGINEQALAIANNMPNLYHLRLFANDLTKEGLQAILDGCPHLESLDLRQCLGVDLGGALGKRCCEQIKNLRLPCDSVDDYKWKWVPPRKLFGNSPCCCWSCCGRWDPDYDSEFYDDDYNEYYGDDVWPILRQ